MAEFYKYECKNWFKELQISIKEFHNLDNALESAKAKYERQNHIYEWVTRTGLGILLTLGLGDVLRISNPLLLILGYIGYIVSLSAVLIGIIAYIISNKRQEVCLMWLFREKDKQERARSIKKDKK